MKPKMYSFLVDDRSEHKKSKCVNKNVAAKINHEDKDVLLNNKCLRYSMNRIEPIETYEINEISLSCFDD